MDPDDFDAKPGILTTSGSAASVMDADEFNALFEAIISDTPVHEGVGPDDFDAPVRPIVPAKPNRSTPRPSILKNSAAAASTMNAAEFNALFEAIISDTPGHEGMRPDDFDAPVHAIVPAKPTRSTPRPSILKSSAAAASVMDIDEFNALFEAIISDTPVREGMVIKGSVTRVAEDHVVVDIGYSSTGTVPLREFVDQSTRELDAPSVGDDVDVFLECLEGDDGLLVLSREKAILMNAWDDVQAAVDEDRVVEGVVIARVRGGLSVDIGVKAFLPGSQVDIRPVRDLDGLIGRRMRFRITKFNKRRGNIVLSSRAVIEEERGAKRDDLLEKLEVGAVLDGVVKNITDYGAFVDLGGLDGLLHVSEMGSPRPRHPSDLYEPHERIQVRVLSFDPARMRVSLAALPREARRPPPRSEPPPVPKPEVSPVAPAPEPARDPRPLPKTVRRARRPSRPPAKPVLKEAPPPKPLVVEMQDPFAIDDF